MPKNRNTEKRQAKGDEKMKQTNYELYKNYYTTTVGRFYTKKQRRRLLQLFAAGYGIDPKSKEFEQIYQTVDAIDSLEIRDSTESKNYRLLCHISQDDGQMDVAASALSACFDERLRNSKAPYASPIAWRSELYTAMPKTKEIRLEIAYIEYACEKLDAAISGLKALADEGCIPAIEHLAYILLEEQCDRDAFFYISLLQEIYTNYFELDFPLWLEENKKRALALVGSNEIEGIAYTVEKKAKQIVGEVANNMHVIGFL